MDTASLDHSVAALKSRKDDWVRLPLAAKRRYLRSVVVRQEAVAADMVTAAVAAKGIPKGPLEAEEWGAGPYCIVRYARLLARTLEHIEKHGSPPVKPGSIHTRAGGRVAVDVFPATTADRILFRGFRAEVWLPKGVTRETLPQNMAGFYRNPPPRGTVGLVLGAGNVASIGPLDVLTKMYAEGQVCLLKLNPVNQYLAPFIEESFADLIRDGYLRLAEGGADVGEYLCGHPDIDAIHITGSDRTHEAIVFGSGEDGRERKRNGRPRLQKPITSELGNVSPVIVVPGPWTDADIRFQAANIATQLVNNAGFNCCAAKVLVLPKEWPAAGVLMEKLRDRLAAFPQRRAYYPGTQERYTRFLASNPTSQPLGEPGAGAIPWTLIPDLDPADATNPCFTTESFCGLLAQTALGGTSAADFLRCAVDFCNQRLWGTLSACILVHPDTRRTLGPDFDNALSRLQYGTVGVNHWPVLSFCWGTTTWGAFPGHTFGDIQSGIGAVHNALLFDNPERTVIYGPFRVRPEPAWYAGNPRALPVFRRMVSMEARPGILNLLSVLVAAVA